MHSFRKSIVRKQLTETTYVDTTVTVYCAEFYNRLLHFNGTYIRHAHPPLQLKNSVLLLKYSCF